MAVFGRDVPEVSVEGREGAVRMHIPTACSMADFTTAAAALAVVAVLGLGIGEVALLMDGVDAGHKADPWGRLAAATWPVRAAVGAGAVAWLAMLAAGALFLAEMAVGVETIELTPEAVAVRRRIGPLGWTRRARVADIRAVRDVEPPRSWQLRLVGYRPMLTGRHARLELELAGGRRMRLATVDAGTNLRIVRGAVNRALTEALPHVPRTSRGPVSAERWDAVPAGR